MKRLLLILVISAAYQPLFAQGFGGGLFAGISTTQMVGDNIVGFHKAGFYGGGFTDFRFTPKSTLQLELAFLQRGSKQTPTVKNGNTSWFYNLNYIEVPVLYRWYGIKNMNLEIGPTVSYLINSKQEDSFGERPFKVDFHPIDLSIAGGLSYYLAKGRVEVNARYSTSVISTGEGDARKWYHHVISFSIRYWFRTSFNQAAASFKKDKVKINIDLGENKQEPKDE